MIYSATKDLTNLKNNSMAFQFRIQLKNVQKPPVWRRVIVPESFTFKQFHVVIQESFGWGNYHLFQFSPSGYGSEPIICNTNYKKIRLFILEQMISIICYVCVKCFRHFGNSIQSFFLKYKKSCLY